jgi:hypothetical protein
MIKSQLHIQREEYASRHLVLNAKLGFGETPQLRSIVSVSARPRFWRLRAPQRVIRIDSRWISMTAGLISTEPDAGLVREDLYEARHVHRIAAAREAQ